MELLLVQRVRGWVDCASGRGSGFENRSFERRGFVGVVEEMVSDLGKY